MNKGRINDYIMCNIDMTPSERVVAGFTVSRANTNNEFFWGAKRLSKKLNVSAPVVRSTWKKMEAWGWISCEYILDENGDRVKDKRGRDKKRGKGRATRWQVCFHQLEADIHLLATNFTTHELPVSTNSLKEYAQGKSLNEYSTKGGAFSETENTPLVSVEEVRTHASFGSKTSSL